MKLGCLALPLPRCALLRRARCAERDVSEDHIGLILLPFQPGSSAVKLVQVRQVANVTIDL